MFNAGIFVLRLGLGVMFIAHGLQLAFGLFGGPGIEGFSQVLAEFKIYPTSYWAYLAAYTLLIGGVFLVLGIFVRTSSLALIIYMAVAIWKVHWEKGFFITDGGWEYNFIIISALLALLIMGAGEISIAQNVLSDI